MRDVRPTRASLRLFVSSRARAFTSCVALALAIGARGRSLIDDTIPEVGRQWSTAMRAMGDEVVPRDALDAVHDFETECLSRGIGAFIDRMTYVNASSDAVEAYVVSTEVCDGTRGAAAMSSARMASASEASRRMRAHVEYLARVVRQHARERANERDAVVLLRETFDEAYRVLTSGICFESEPRLSSPAARAGDARALATTMRAEAREELRVANLAYIENAFANTTVDAWIERIFTAYDVCRVVGKFWSAPVSKNAFDLIQAHYNALDFLTTSVNSGSEMKRTGSRAMAFLINAARDVLRSADSCGAATKIENGRYFVSRTFDVIMSELSLECGLSRVGLEFLDFHTRDGSHSLSLELEEISHIDQWCSQSNASASTIINLNAHALLDLVRGLETIDTSMMGCHRGREPTRARELASALARTIEKVRDSGCVSVAGSFEAAAVSAMTRETVNSITTGTSPTPTTSATPVSEGRLAMVSAALATAFISVLALIAWITFSCAKRTMATHKRAPSNGYARYVDDDIPSEETRVRALRRSPGSPPRSTRRFSFSAADANYVQRTRSLDPEHLHFS